VLDFDRKYNEQIDELFRLHTSVQSVGFTNASYKPGLENIRTFDESLGSPSQKFKSIHVAGTNGKGSVASMMAASLAADGLKVGLYTSPHLLDFRERIKILDPDFRLIPREKVFDFIETAKKTSSLYSKLSFFEITTEMAFKWFAEEKVDCAVVETGLGGRLDATNIITPELSVITSIGLDHCAILGHTRALIAAEKAGIFKPGRPALVWGHDKECDPIFKRIAAQVGSPLHYGPEATLAEHGEMDLRGPYQRENLRTALAALALLGRTANMDAIRSAARISGLRGRWEMVSEQPQVICDIGHNPPALEINFRRLREMKRPLTIVYGIMADKDLTSIAALMPPKARYVLVAPDTPRALPVQDLRKLMRELRPDLETETADSVAEGLRRAISQAREDELIYVGGSTFVVAEALKNF